MNGTSPAARRLTAWDTDRATRSARHDAGLAPDELGERAKRAAVAGAYALLAAEQSLPVERIVEAPAELFDPPDDMAPRLSQRDAARALADLRSLGLA